MRIEGIQSLNEKLGGLYDAAADAYMERAVGNQIKKVQAAAKLGCPVNDGELRQSIKVKTEKQDGYVFGICYTNKAYGMYVEMGTGPAGEANHSGISPALSPSYSHDPWWIHESQVDAAAAEKYGWPKYETDEGIFYLCSGQAAQPYMYPALKNNEHDIAKNIGNYLAKKIREEAEK